MLAEVEEVSGEEEQSGDEEEERAGKRRRVESEANDAEFQASMNFVDKVKARLLMAEHGGPHQYKAFLNALHGYKKSSGSIRELYEEMGRIFADHPDLMEGLKAYLPAGEPQTGGADHNQNCSTCGRSYHSKSGKPGGKCKSCR